MKINSIWFSFKSLAKFVDDFFYGQYVFVLRMCGVVDYPVPPRSGMRKTSSRSFRHFYESGIRSALPIAYAVVQKKGSFEGFDVLDFGCGVGRQLLHLTLDYPNNRYFACDVDRYSIDYIRKTYSCVDAVVNKFSPPLPFGEASFDVIYSVSIFSHLNPRDQSVWLRELARVLRPGGLALLTVEGAVALAGDLSESFGIDRLQLQKKLNDDGILYKEYEERVYTKASGVLERFALGLGIQGSYGNTVVSRGFVEENWQKYELSLLGYIPGIIDGRQDLIVLEKLLS